MRGREGRKRRLAVASLVLCVAACSGNSQTKGQAKGGKSKTTPTGSDVFGNAKDAGADRGAAGSDGGTSAGTLAIEPRDPTVTVTNGQAQTIDFVAKLGTKTTNALWSISRAEIGSIDVNSGHFTTAALGGRAEIMASAATGSGSTFVTVVLMNDQNGTSASMSCNAGGCGGVGGEGEGPAVSDADRKLLDGAPTAASQAALSWLYPYDGTVWPLGLLAPLLQWAFDSAMPADAIKLVLDGNDYHYTGYFGRPAALAAGMPFVRHPIPQDVWDAATRSSARGALSVTLTVLAQGKAFGPIKETWPIAGGALKGTVYYQSYGTKLAHNYTGAKGGDGMFGGATLAIQGGSTAPTLVAGGDGDHTKCRVCHTVSADGSRMIVQHGDDYKMSSSYALNATGYPETPYTARGLMGWAGLYPDGSIALGNTAKLDGDANNGVSATALIDANMGVVIPSQGLTDFVTRAGMPMFSPDGKQAAFVFNAGPGDATVGPGDESKLVAMDFDVATSTFANARLVYQGQSGNRPGWPAFMPTGDRIVFQIDLPSGQNRNQYFATRYGARGELWWADLTSGAAHPLDRANGKDQGVVYLPNGKDNHDHDAELSYEPTVSPIASGGYAWVVFTSRRLYGNVATIDPTFSDPREHDLTQTPTPKKLWVAAIDLPKPGGEVNTIAQPSDDPSHPAFYMPAQELLAGNSRGFWVPEPCRKDGADCDSGDQCCGGFCAQDAQQMKNICSGTPPDCSREYDRCTVTSDCCDYKSSGLVCINQRCALPVPS